jgi:hypothetical protein
VTASQAGDVCITCCLCRRLCHRHRASLTSSCPEQSLSIPIQPGNCHDRSLSSESITLSSAHLLGLFREFRHYILPCQHDGHSKPASVLLFKVSWWQLDLCKSHLGRYARSRQVSIQQIRVHATDDRTRSLWTPFSESPSHGIRSRYYLFRVCTNPFMLLFGTVLPCFLHGSRMWLDWCASQSSPIASFTTPNSYRCPFLAFNQSAIPPQRDRCQAAKASLVYGSMPNKAA